MMSGKIVTIEGLDGAGKSTQIELLIERLDRMGIKHRFVHFPIMEYGSYGPLIAEFLRGEFGTVDRVHPKLVALLFAENRNEYQPRLKEWLDQGNLIILDRYVNSNIAFQCAKIRDPIEKRKLKDWILDFEFVHNGLPRPDISFFLDVPFGFIINSLNKNRTGKDREYLQGKTDIHEASLELQKNVYLEYQALLEEQNHFFKIECASSHNDTWLSAENIHNKLFDQVVSSLSLPTATAESLRNQN